MSSDDLIRHQIRLQRFAAGNVRLVGPMVRRIAAAIRARIALDSLTADQLMRSAIALRDIEAAVADQMTRLAEELEPSLKGLAAYEAERTVSMLQKSINVEMVGISEEMINAAVTRYPMALIEGQSVERMTLGGLYRQFESGMARDIRQMVQAGAIEGRTTQQMTRDLTQMVTTRSRRQAEALVRTATNHIAAVARDAVTQANAALFDGEIYVATLDARTTISCASKDGQVYPLGVGPMPPLHMNCRSVRIAQVKERYRVPGFSYNRASVDGPVSSRTTYQSFLKRQDSDFQDEVLGKERADLFRSGKVTLDRFTDDRGVVYTLDELKRREGF